MIFIVQFEGVVWRMRTVPRLGLELTARGVSMIVSEWKLQEGECVKECNKWWRGELVFLPVVANKVEGALNAACTRS